MSVIRGALWGLVLGGAGVSVASVVGPQPAGNAPPSTPPLVDAPQAASVTAPDSTAPDAPTASDVSPTATAPQVTAPQPAAPALEGDTDPLARPDASDVADAPKAPPSLEDPDLQSQADSPVLPTPQSRAPQVPTLEGDLVVDTAPAAPVLVITEDAAPDDVVVEALPVETPPTVAAETTTTAVDDAATVSTTDAAETAATAEAEPTTPSTDAATITADAAVETATAVADPPAARAANADVADIATDVDTAAPSTEAETSVIAQADVAPTPETSDTAPTVTAEADPTPTPSTPTQTPPAVNAEDANTADPAGVAAPTITAQTPADAITPAPTDEVIAGAEVVDDTPATAPDATTDQAPADPPVVVSLIDGARSALPQGNSSVRVNRVGAGNDDDAAPAAETPPAEAAAPTGVPLNDFAASFDNPDGKPLLSIILLDDGGIDAGPALLAQLPFPITVLVDAGTAEAADKMTAYRAAGIEVGAALNLPEGATATDVEITLEASRTSLGEAVVITDMGTADRRGRDQLIAALSGEGRGFVSLSKGLSNGLREAESAGVPAVSIFRDLDAEGQDARVIRRFLDQAAFRARQDSGVVLLGRVRPDTLSALTLWGTANRAGQVAVAPVSAVMQANDD